LGVKLPPGAGPECPPHYMMCRKTHAHCSQIALRPHRGVWSTPSWATGPTSGMVVVVQRGQGWRMGAKMLQMKHLYAYFYWQAKISHSRTPLNRTWSKLATSYKLQVLRIRNRQACLSLCSSVRKLKKIRNKPRRPESSIDRTHSYSTMRCHIELEPSCRRAPLKFKVKFKVKVGCYLRASWSTLL
jgi:hypothetical protein